MTITIKSAVDSTCPICGQIVEGSREHPLSDVQSYKCPVCGEYAITREARVNMKSMAKEDKAKISAYTRERQIHRRPKVTILSRPPSALSTEGAVVEVDDILKTGFPSAVSERLDRALRNLHRQASYLGEKILLNPESDYPVVFAVNKEEVFFVLNALEKDGWINRDATIGMSRVNLTVDGWNRIAELERTKGRKDSRQAFVAMWFDGSMEKAYKEGFEKAIKDAGFEPLRVDLREHNDKICDVIIAEIRKSRFMVADFTGHRGGVYFEAGFAQGLGIPVIWACKDSDKDTLHFDTRQYNHILWTDEVDLYGKLLRRIEATIRYDS